MVVTNPANFTSFMEWDGNQQNVPTTPLKLVEADPTRLTIAFAWNIPAGVNGPVVFAPTRPRLDGAPVFALTAAGEYQDFHFDDYGTLVQEDWWALSAAGNVLITTTTVAFRTKGQQQWEQLSNLEASLLLLNQSVLDLSNSLERVESQHNGSLARIPSNVF